MSTYRTPAQRDQLKGRRAAVWASVYAAEWARLFNVYATQNGFNHLEVDPHTRDKTRFSHAGRAATVADLAVADLDAHEDEAVGG